jgi:hypothetical protein
MQKKIDVTEEAHIAVSRFCERNNTTIKSFASAVLLRETRKITGKKKLEVLRSEMTTEANSVWLRPPFWIRS